MHYHFLRLDPQPYTPIIINEVITSLVPHPKIKCQGLPLVPLPFDPFFLLILFFLILYFSYQKENSYQTENGRYQRSEQNSQRKTVGGSKNDKSLIAQSFSAGLKVTGTRDVD